MSTLTFGAVEMIVSGSKGCQGGVEHFLVIVCPSVFLEVGGAEAVGDLAQKST
jgi:hypothetical protein